MKLIDVSKSYGRQTVFDRFSLEIEEGKILCVLGPSGTGKTTLLNMLAGLVDYEGKIEGVPERISYIFQEPRLLPALTLRQNLSFVGGSPERIDRLLAGVELADMADKRPGKLSGGEKQRVSLARAFCVPFDLLLMDEPFSLLDTALKIRLTDLFARLWWEEIGNGRRTAVFVTHDLEEALSLADRVIVLRDGAVALDLPITRTSFPLRYGHGCPEREQILSVLLGEGTRTSRDFDLKNSNSND